VLFIVADDLGYNDLGYMNRDMLTPNLDNLATTGTILTQAYVYPLCSPSRSAFMTGYMAYHTGLQHGVIQEEQPVGLPLNLTTLPKRFRNMGYKTHMAGKWHLGFCNWDYTPRYRGFDSFVGYYVGMEEYYSHKRQFRSSSNGLDFRFNEEPYPQKKGVYSTYVFGNRAVQVVNEHNTSEPLFLYLPFQSVHWPLEVPEVYENMYKHVNNIPRRKYSGMVSAMDEAVGNVTAALRKKGMLDDTLVFFTTDNGGLPTKAGNNWPLRGGKTTLWEGGTRGLAFVNGPGFRKGAAYEGLFHAADWYPTILGAVGATAEPDIDGIDQWERITKSSGPYPRQDMVYQVDRLSRHGAYRFGDYKLIVGSPGKLNEWYPVPKFEHGTGFAETLTESHLVSLMENEANKVQTIPYRLFNVRDDPEERVDLSTVYPDVLGELLARYRRYAATEIPPNFPPNEDAADPKHFGGVWSPGWC
jgi:arylsulfatase A-like enzyme